MLLCTFTAEIGIKQRYSSLCETLAGGRLAPPGGPCVPCGRSENPYSCWIFCRAGRVSGVRIDYFWVAQSDPVILTQPGHHLGHVAYQPPGKGSDSIHMLALHIGRKNRWAKT